MNYSKRFGSSDGGYLQGTTPEPPRNRSVRAGLATPCVLARGVAHALLVICCT
jgi:hypothetical protein